MSFLARKYWKVPHPQVAGGDAGEDGSGDGGLAVDDLAGGDGGEGAGGGNAEGVHGFAEEVLAEDGPEGGSAVAAAGEGCGAGALELEVVAQAGSWRRPRRGG